MRVPSKCRVFRSRCSSVILVENLIWRLVKCQSKVYKPKTSLSWLKEARTKTVLEATSNRPWRNQAPWLYLGEASAIPSGRSIDRALLISFNSLKQMSTESLSLQSSAWISSNCLAACTSASTENIKADFQHQKLQFLNKILLTMHLWSRKLACMQQTGQGRKAKIKSMPQPTGQVLQIPRTACGSNLTHEKNWRCWLTFCSHFIRCHWPWLSTRALPPLRLAWQFWLVISSQTLCSHKSQIGSRDIRFSSQSTFSIFK